MRRSTRWGSRGNSDPESELPRDFDERGRSLGPAATGFVHAIDFENLAAAAKRADVLVSLTFRAGDFVIAKGGGVGVYPASRADPDLIQAVAEAVAVGAHRTPVQDLDFAIRHLVEIAVWALSPGINDPYTAVSVMGQLSAAIARLLSAEMPAGVFRDARGRVRVLCPGRRTRRRSPRPSTRYVRAAGTSPWWCST